MKVHIERFLYMNKLIIITGISGTGKTALADMLYNKIDSSTKISYDKLGENIYDIVGFKNSTEKKSLRFLVVELYKNLIEECMKRKDKVIILEKPFKAEWKNFFERLARQYNYEIYTINMFAENFDIIWRRLLKREASKKDRHPAHYLNCYNLKDIENYEPYFEYEYDVLKKEYDNLISNNINLGKVIQVEDIEKLDISKLISQIM